MNSRLIQTLFLLFMGLMQAKAQPEKHKINIYCLELTDKNNSPYSIFSPQEYLSARALERRERQGIGIEETDIPVNPAYIEEIKQAGGIIHATSKWFNSVAVYCKDSSILGAVSKLPFVRAVSTLGKWREPRPFPIETKRTYKTDYKKTPHYHGYAAPQTAISNMQVLHRWGHQGQGMHVAIFDGGFSNVYRAPSFDSLNVRGQILSTRDFVDHNEYVYESSTHGTNVLSCMAANLPYLIVGTSPYAHYHLFKTEDVMGEFRAEEFNWVAAAELADSLGVDVINSSLGYTEFNDTTMSYKYRHLNGKTALVSRGADMAVSKGMLVVNSAGNEGDGKWRYIGTPADAFNVVTVAAVNVNGKRAKFSSWGPTPDGRIKPNVAAVGDNTVVAQMTDYEVSSADGTSFSSPVLAGMLTTFWQIFPDKTNMEIKSLMEETASQALAPDVSLGYGIPDFYVAYIKAAPALVLIDVEGNAYSKQTLIEKELPILIEVEKSAVINIKLYNSLQQVVFQRDSLTASQEVFRYVLQDLDQYPLDVYSVLVEVNGARYYFEVPLHPFAINRE